MRENGKGSVYDDRKWIKDKTMKRKRMRERRERAYY